MVSRFSTMLGSILWTTSLVILNDASVVHVAVDADAGLSLVDAGASTALLQGNGHKCPASDQVALGTSCLCGARTCAKQKFCYAKTGKGVTCNDAPRYDPSMLDWHGITGRSGPDGRDIGPIRGREFTFRKKSDKSGLRLFYSDNFRVHCHHHSSGASRWEIKIDRKSCPSGPIRQDLHVHKGENPHRINGFGGYCTGISKGEHTVSVDVAATPGYDAANRHDAYTGWEGWGSAATFHLEAQEVPHSYPLFHVTKGAINDGRDSGTVAGRELTFKKQFEDSRLRLFFSDNLRVMGHGHVRACRWHIRIDGEACPSGTVMGDVYVHQNDNVHRPRSIMGYCDNVKAGEHKVDVFVSPTPGYSCDAFTGWNAGHFVLEAEEIPREYSLVQYRGNSNQFGDDSGDIPYYKISFTKQHKESRLRLFYSDNLRCYAAHHHCACKWEIHIDGKNCPSVDIFGQVYVHKHPGDGKDTNPHRHRSFAGFCDDVSSGEHTAVVHLKPQGPSCDAYTGWKNSPANQGSRGFLEVHEFFRPCISFAESDCKEPRCTWNKGVCADLVLCPGHDKVAVGSACMCGKSEAAEGKFCYKDKTVHDAALVEKEKGSSYRIRLMLTMIPVSLSLAHL